MMNTNYHLFAFAICFWVSQANSVECTDWKEKLQADIQLANQCESKYQACLSKEFGNPMRELDYCKKVNERCQSLDSRPDNGSLPQEVAAYKKKCEP
jgi:hypothetical protein